MSDGPETIWIDALGIPESEKYAGTYYLNDDEDHRTIKYRRADLPPTHEQLMADPRVKALVEAGDVMARALRGDYIVPGSAKAWDAALDQLKGPKP